MAGAPGRSIDIRIVGVTGFEHLQRAEMYCRVWKSVSEGRIITELRETPGALFDASAGIWRFEDLDDGPIRLEEPPQSDDGRARATIIIELLSLIHI